MAAGLGLLGPRPAIIDLPSHADNVVARCIRVDGLEIPKHHSAHVHVAYEFRWKSTGNWGSATIDPTSVPGRLQLQVDDRGRARRPAAGCPEPLRPGARQAAGPARQPYVDQFNALWNKDYTATRRSASRSRASARPPSAGSCSIPRATAGPTSPSACTGPSQPTPTAAARPTTTRRERLGREPRGLVHDRLRWLLFHLADGREHLGPSGSNTLASGFKYYIALCDLTDPTPGGGTAMPSTCCIGRRGRCRTPSATRSSMKRTSTSAGRPT